MSNVPKLRFSDFEEDWQISNLRELSREKFSNGVFNDPKKVGRGYRLVNVKDMFEGNSINADKLSLLELEEKEFSKNQVHYGDIFFTRSSLVAEGIAVSNVFLSKQDDVTYDGHLVRMRPNLEQLYPPFLSAALKTSKLRKQLIVRGKTTTMTTIGQEDISSVELDYPSQDEQQKIAAFLTAVDTKIEQLTQKEALLKQYKKGVMQKIFSQEIRFKADDGSEFPEWSNAKLSQIADVVGGGTPDTSISDYWDGEIDWFTPTEIKTKYLGHSARKISDKGLAKSSAKLLPVGTLLLSTRATVGDVGISTVPCTTNQGFQSLVVNDQNDHEFVYYWICFNKRELIRRASGSTFLEIGKKEISKIIVQRPSLEEQSHIARFLQSIDAKLMHLADQLASAKTFKKGLLQQMFV